MEEDYLLIIADYLMLASDHDYRKTDYRKSLILTSDAIKSLDNNSNIWNKLFSEHISLLINFVEQYFDKELELVFYDNSSCRKWKMNTTENGIVIQLLQKDFEEIKVQAGKYFESQLSFPSIIEFQQLDKEDEYCGFDYRKYY